MNTRKMTADLRKRLKKRKQQITDQELFLSEPYRAPLWRLARALSQKPSVTLSIYYDESPKSQAAFTDGTQITLNAGNAVSRSFPSREEKVASHEGLIAHECGHILCSDFNRRSHYVGGFREGLCYPTVPKQRDRADRTAWAEMKEYLAQKNPAAVLWITKTAAYLNNILEDVYIEVFMCQEYPGTVRNAIRKNAEIIIRKIPTLQERNAAGGSALDIMMDLIFRYARAGRTAEEVNYPKQYQICLNRCKNWIDDSVRKNDPDIRFHASNQILLKIWQYLKKVICDANAQIEQEKICSEQIQEWLDSHWKDKICWVSLSEAGTGGKILTTPPESWNGSLEQKPQEPSVHEWEPDEETAEKIQDTEQQSSDKHANMREEAEETAKAEKSDQWNILDELPDILNQLAGHMEAREDEKKRKENLQKDLEDIPKSKIHADCHYQLHREVDISEKSIHRYLKIEKESRRTAERLVKLMEDILQQREGGILKSLYMGKRLSRGELYRRDGKIFEKKLLPEEEPSIAFAILVDVSGSMKGARIENARKTALALYWFCGALSIPVLVYGHSVHNTCSSEVVDICSYAEFDAIDGNDAVRIAGMETIDCNRDGAALRYVGERLLKRDEDIKILVLISDGQPNANGYTGELARKDLVETKHNLEKRGIHLFAAAIGADKEQIERIYQNGFLNISDLKTMPVKLTKLLMAYLR